MKYTVVWLPAAERDLARIFVAAAHKREVTRAADALDRVLRRFPGLLGESRENDVRIAFEKPLAIKFRVLEEDRRVEIGDVWRFR